MEYSFGMVKLKQSIIPVLDFAERLNGLIL